MHEHSLRCVTVCSLLLNRQDQIYGKEIL